MTTTTTRKPLADKATKKPVVELFCIRCGREAGGHKWCDLCHTDLNNYLKWMTGSCIVCPHCRATTRPGILIYTRECCPRCQFDLSAELADSKPHLKGQNDAAV